MEERVEFFNDRNEKLVGILHKANSKELMIFCHGLRSSKDHSALRDVVRGIHSNGRATLRFDFSGHGESEGNGFMNFSQQVSDIGAAIRHFGPSFDEIILVGGSLSAFIVAIACTRYNKLSRLITFNGFFDIKKLPLKFYPFLLSALWNKEMRTQLRFYRRNYVPENISLPVLIVHAENYAIVDVSHSKEFYSRLATGKSLGVLPDIDHSLTKQSYVDEVVGVVCDWLPPVGICKY